jgi:hypothetical protein
MEVKSTEITATAVKSLELVAVVAATTAIAKS